MSDSSCQRTLTAPWSPTVPVTHKQILTTHVTGQRVTSWFTMLAQGNTLLQEQANIEADNSPTAKHTASRGQWSCNKQRP
jgi:hypothetical protein